MNFNAHQMTTIRFALDRVARDECGQHVQMARLLREQLTVELVVAPGIRYSDRGAVNSQKAFDTLVAHAHHGFKYGHFSGEFNMDNGTYKFQTSTEDVCIEENHHQGNSYKKVPHIKFTFHPWALSSKITAE